MTRYFTLVTWEVSGAGGDGEFESLVSQRATGAAGATVSVVLCLGAILSFTLVSSVQCFHGLSAVPSLPFVSSCPGQPRRMDR